ncbi:MAG: formate dehydrogenase accessory sulfurtransferase FdhD [Candidatus Eremiobacteraeota bacterium]|nr:formate dehydrogenase accessory sulfurtransferase FdhD [Candidatus Eremiobacteraeota bacterium]
MSRSDEVSIRALDGGAARDARDAVAVEEPLEIRLRAGGETRTLAITMRTPGNDLELAAGFALGEGIVRSRAEIAEIVGCDDGSVRIGLTASTMPQTAAFERHFAITSACGVCGRAELQALSERIAPIASDLRIDTETLYALPGRMRTAQRVFERTGGIHAAALFDTSGTLLAVREDVGRHNALDKLIGWALLEGRDCSATIVLVSGRASYELAQKAACARIPILCSVSAPSSLAIDLATEFGLTLVGFLRDRRANVYAGADRIVSGALRSPETRVTSH